MASQGPFYGTVFSSEGAGLPWASPGNAGASDDARAGAGFTLGAIDEVTQALRVTGFPFMAEPDSEIDGVIVAIERSESGPDVLDSEVRLVYQGVAIGEDKPGGTEWPLVDAVATYGAAADDWSVALTPAIINDATFGVQLRATSSSGLGPLARVDGITITFHYTPAAVGAGTGTKLNHRVRALLREIDPRDAVVDTVEIDAALAESMMTLASFFPMPERRIENALTIAPGANSFALPTSHADFVQAIEYGGAIALERARDGVFIQRVSMDKMDSLRDGLADGRTGPPRYFALWEEAGQVVSGLCYPRAERAEPCHLHFAHVPDALDRFPDLDDSRDPFSRYARVALVHHAAAMLAARMPAKDRERRRITRGIVARWRTDAFRAANAAEACRLDVASVGRMLELVP